MKSFASKFNKTTFGIDTTDFQYTKLADIFNSENEGGKDVVHKINGLYVHKSQLGDSPVIIDEENKRCVKYLPMMRRYKLSKTAKSGTRFTSTRATARSVTLFRLWTCRSLESYV